MEPVQKFQVRETGNMGNGIFSTADIAEGETILQDTNQPFITYDLLANYTEFHELLYRETVDPKVLFAFFLAAVSVVCDYEQISEHMRIIEYIQALPEKYHSLLAWNYSQLQLLEDR